MESTEPMTAYYYSQSGEKKPLLSPIDKSRQYENGWKKTLPSVNEMLQQTKQIRSENIQIKSDIYCVKEEPPHPSKFYHPPKTSNYLLQVPMLPTNKSENRGNYTSYDTTKHLQQPPPNLYVTPASDKPPQAAAYPTPTTEYSAEQMEKSYGGMKPPPLVYEPAHTNTPATRCCQCLHNSSVLCQCTNQPSCGGPSTTYHPPSCHHDMSSHFSTICAQCHHQGNVVPMPQHAHNGGNYPANNYPSMIKTSNNGQQSTEQEYYTHHYKHPLPPSTSIASQRKRWTREEHEKFLEGLSRYGRKWKKIQSYVKTKTAVQVRTHAYGYFSKLLRNMPDEEEVWEIAKTMSSLPTAVIKGPGNNKKGKEPRTDEAGMLLLRKYVFSKGNNKHHEDDGEDTEEQETDEKRKAAKLVMAWEDSNEENVEEEEDAKD